MQTIWPVSLLVLLGLTISAHAEPKAAVFGFTLIDSSSLGAASSSADEGRIAALDSQLEDRLRQAGYEIADTAPVAAQVKVQDLQDCGECAANLAHQLGAAVSVYGWVQKVSNLILDINLVIRSADSGAMLRAGSVSIRGDTDESWRRGLDYLLSERIFPNGEGLPQ